MALIIPITEILTHSRGANFARLHFPVFLHGAKKSWEVKSGDKATSRFFSMAARSNLGEDSWGYEASKVCE